MSALEHALPRSFSVDLFGVVADYYGFAPSSATAQPTWLFSFNNRVDEAHGVVATADGNFWMLIGNKLMVFDGEARFVRQITDNAQYWHYAEALAADGDEVFVSGPQAIGVFRLNGKLTRSFPASNGALAFGGMALDSNFVFVTSTHCNDVQMFARSDGEFVSHWPRPPWRGDDETSNFVPVAIAIHPDSGEVFISDRDNHCVKVFSKDGDFLRKFGCKGERPGEFMWTHGLAFDAAANLLVVDANHHRVQVLEPAKGKVVTMFGEYGVSQSALYYPQHIAVDCAGRIVVSDLSPCVKVFAF